MNRIITQTPMGHPSVDDLAKALLIRDLDVLTPQPPDLERLQAALGVLAIHGSWTHESEVAWRTLEELQNDLSVRSWLGYADGFYRRRDLESSALSLLHLLSEIGPVRRRVRDEQHAFVAGVRRLAQIVGRTSARETLEDRVASFTAANDDAPESRFVQAWSLYALDRPADALDILALAPNPKRLGAVDLDAERGLMLYHLRRFGAAALALQSTRGRAPSETYDRAQQTIEEVWEFVGAANAPVHYPERLIDIIAEELDTDGPLGYDPNPHSVAVIAASLAAGGGERQVVTTVRWLLRHQAVSDVSFLVRSVDPARNHHLLHDMLDDAHVVMKVYGDDPIAGRHQIGGALARRPRLAKAVDLLPTSFRAEVLRLLEHLLSARPHAVHVSQDNYYAAVAGAIAGVPNLVLRRGSLAPPYWRGTNVQEDTHFRPMGHTYRRLMETGRLLLMNNSARGSQTDREWVGVDDDSRYCIIRNGVDFSLLDAMVEDGQDPRGILGIPAGVPVVGGAFRLEPVKRPLLWMQAAAIVAQERFDVHFLVIGEGALRARMVQIAIDGDFVDRLHLVGHRTDVANWYQTMDVTLLTSEREGTPNALIEALHFGVPAVATDVGGIPEVVGDAGTLVPPYDGPEAYAQALLDYLNDETALREAGARAVAHVRQMFDVDHALDPLLRAYGLEPAESNR